MKRYLWVILALLGLVLVAGSLVVDSCSEAEAAHIDLISDQKVAADTTFTLGTSITEANFLADGDAAVRLLYVVGTDTTAYGPYMLRSGVPRKLPPMAGKKFNTMSFDLVTATEVLYTPVK